MSGPTTPPVTEAAVAALVKGLGIAGISTGIDVIRAALEAAAPHMVRPPTLPTEQGSVVLATRILDCEFDSPVLAVRVLDGQSDPWATPGIRLAHPVDGAATIWSADAAITEWIPARVVPDDEHGPVAVLRRVAEQLKNRPTVRDLADDVNDALIVIGVCLERLDGDQ